MCFSSARGGLVPGTMGKTGARPSCCAPVCGRGRLSFCAPLVLQRRAADSPEDPPAAFPTPSLPGLGSKPGSSERASGPDQGLAGLAGDHRARPEGSGSPSPDPSDPSPRLPSSHPSPTPPTRGPSSPSAPSAPGWTIDSCGRPSNEGRRPYRLGLIQRGCPRFGS